MTTQLPSASQAKHQAQRLRSKTATDGTPISHAKSLELIAHQYGFRDWNAMIASVGGGPRKDWAPGDKVEGAYLSHSFTARVVAAAIVRHGWFRLELHLDEAVDVVTSDGFSNFRTRIRGVVGPKGRSLERTSDGRPHLQIYLW